MTGREKNFDVLCEILIALMPEEARRRLRNLRDMEPLTLQRERSSVAQAAALADRERQFEKEMTEARSQVQAMHEQASKELADANSVRQKAKTDKLEADLLLERARAKLENAGKMESLWEEKMAALRGFTEKIQA